VTGLDALPAEFEATRASMHQLAYFALSPARYRRVGKMGLRATTGGFGTPVFDGELARVEEIQLVHESGEGIATALISTVREATRFLGVDYDPDWFTDFKDPLTPVDPDSDLDIDESASVALGNWFDFGARSLEALRTHGGEDDDVSEVQLWPEHFDLATELGDADRGGRASYGASPGDAAHNQPYVYVAAWGEIDRAVRYWNDRAFNGASLGHEDLLASVDPVQTAVDFFLEGYRLLHAS
jgi:hypothetical protein